MKILNQIIQRIGSDHRDVICENSRHYIEVNIGKQAEEEGVQDLPEVFRKAHAIVPLKTPVKGMKVRIDGRTFVDYRQFESGVVLPGYVAGASDMPSREYMPNDSMILNFS